jgi:copper chaperone CopZ
MTTLTFKISPNMVCDGCKNTVESRLKSVKGVDDALADVATQTAVVTTVDPELACQCEKQQDGTCPCGTNCTCMQKALMKAVADAGFTATPKSNSKFASFLPSTTTMTSISVGVMAFALGYVVSKKYGR